MLRVVLIKDRTIGCVSNFLVDHHKAPIETKVAVARIRWSSYKQGTTNYHNHAFMCSISKTEQGNVEGIGIYKFHLGEASYYKI